MRKLNILFLLFITLTSIVLIGKFWNKVEGFEIFSKTLAKADSYPPVIKQVKVSQTVVFDNCNNVEGRCSENKEKIDVFVDAKDRENDPLTYNYTVSGGKIIGKGKNVVWDLSEVETGNYTLTATVDDGCGVCAQPKTVVVDVVECPQELSKNVPPDFITELYIDKSEVKEFCKKKKRGCYRDLEMINIFTKTLGTDKTQLNYKYEVSGGEIIGNGADVKWDVSNVETSGTYKITASVDAGRGFCQNPVSSYVQVEKCSKCKSKR